MTLSQREHANPLRVLYVHHAGPFGGASRSLFELIQSFPPNAVHPLVLTRSGQFQQLLATAGLDVIGCAGVSQFDNTRYSHYRGWRWLVLLRELAYLPSTTLGLLAARRRWARVDVVHINDVTLLPAIWLAKMMFGCPIVVHVRSVQQPMQGWRGRLIASVLHSCAQQIVAIDETVKASLDPSLNALMIHNGLRVPSRDSSPAAGVNTIFTVGMVGGLSRAKGCLELLAAAALCKTRGADIRFVFVGQSMRQSSTVRDIVLRQFGLSQEIEREMQEMIGSLSLASVVEFWPFTTNLEEVYRRFDVVCFPSHFDAPGRPIFEAAFFGVPSIAAITMPTSDTIVDGVTGLTVRPREARQLADAIMYMYEHPDKRAEMGRNAARLAREQFDAGQNAANILGMYRQLARA